MIWSPEEDELLRVNYQKTKKEILSLFPHRTANAIQGRASLLGLKKETNLYKQSSLDLLLEDTPLSYYIIGLILSDGSFYKNAITISLQACDKDYIDNIADILKTKTRLISSNKKSYKAQDQYRIHCKDSIIVPQLKIKFDIKQAKTYHPPIYTLPDNELPIALLIGMIDGDGCIRKRNGKRNDYNIRILCHSSWLDYYTNLCNSLIKQSLIQISYPYIDKKSGYMIWNIASHKIMAYLYLFIQKYNLPILKRKWAPVETFILKTIEKITNESISSKN